MNSAVIAQRSNSRFFFTSLAFALGLVVASGFLVRGSFSVDTGGVAASTKSCLAIMRTNGFSPVVSGKTLTVTLAGDVSKLESLVYKSGVIIASCPAYALTDYCAGGGCSKPGLSFSLTKKEL